MRKICLIVCALVCAGGLFGQENVEVPLDNDRSWDIFYEDENVILSSLTRLCEDPAGGPSANYVFISLDNKKEGDVLIGWHYDIYNSLECISCIDSDDEYNFEYTLASGQSIIPNCDFKNIAIDNGRKTIFFSIYLSQAKKQSDNDVVRLELTNLVTNFSE